MFFWTTSVPETNNNNNNNNNTHLPQHQKHHQQDVQRCTAEEALIRHPFGLTADVIKIVILRGMCGGCGFCFYFYTISVLPLGDAVTILSLNPVITVLIASVVLHEQLTRAHIFAALASVTGSIFLARPSFLFDENDTIILERDADDSTLSSAAPIQWGYITGFLGTCCGAGVYILIRKAGKKGVHTLNLLFSWCVFGLMFSTIILCIAGKFSWPSSNVTWMYILASCIFGTSAHFLLNYAARLAPAGVAAIIRSSGIVWSYLLEVIVFHEVPQAWTLLGVGLIMASLLVIALEKNTEAHHQGQQGQQKLTHDNETKYSSLQLQELNISGVDVKAGNAGSGCHDRHPSTSSYGSLDDEIQALVGHENDSQPS
jgi:drug/metabolite transporter (DMT)-like permease